MAVKVLVDVNTQRCPLQCAAHGHDRPLAVGEVWVCMDRGTHTREPIRDMILSTLS